MHLILYNYHFKTFFQTTMDTIMQVIATISPFLPLAFFVAFTQPFPKASFNIAAREREMHPMDHTANLAPSALADCQRCDDE
jgi:hypothetical protein